MIYLILQNKKFVQSHVCLRLSCVRQFSSWSQAHSTMVFWQWHGVNHTEFQGLLLKGNKQASDFRLPLQVQEIEFSKSITALCIYFDENITVDDHANTICLKVSRKSLLCNDLPAWLTYRVGRLFIIASLFQALLIVPMFSSLPTEKAIEILIFLFTKMHFKMSSVKWRPFCPRGGGGGGWVKTLVKNWQGPSWQLIFHVLSWAHLVHLVLSITCHWMNYVFGIQRWTIKKCWLCTPWMLD